MTDSTVTQITIECSPNAADEIFADLAEVSDGNLMRADKDNLDGGLQTVLIVAQTAAPFFAALVPLLIPYLTKSKVTRIKFKKPDGTEVEISNPTKEQLEKYEI